MDTIETDEINRHLKISLKNKNITYKDLAQRMQMSESGVKKIFAAKDWSLKRLSEVCRAIDISMSELFKASENKEKQEIRFRPEQEAYFLKNKNHFAVYWKLLYERKTIDEIKSEFKLSDNAILTCLNRLDRLRLIRLMPGGKIKIPPIQSVSWVGEGPLIRSLYQEWGVKTISDLAKPNLGPDELFIIRYFKVKPSTYNELKQSLKKLEEEFLFRSTREMRTNSRGLKNVRWVVGLDTKSFVSGQV